MESNQLINMLTILLGIMIGILCILCVVFLALKIKSREHKEKKVIKQQEENIKLKAKTLTTQKYTKESIFKFMEFDKIDDNMILQKGGKRFLMVIECQGVNYDLMSGLEKNSVEQGFLQFLNTLRYPIQIYVQTRTVNLESGLIKYKERVQAIRDRLLKKQMEYNRLEGLGYSKEELTKAALEVTRERNLYEYGVDIVNSTERMSLNKNILRKHYYVIISYTPEEVSNSNYNDEEIKNMAFSDLYTKSQSIINALGVCSVNGKILDSAELAELLYIAYNRDESETYDLNKAINAGYDEMYTTAPDVLKKRMQEINKRIEEEARRKANDVIYETMEESEEEKRVKAKEKEMDDLIDQMAKMIIEENESIIGKDIAEKAKEKVTKRGRKPKKVTEEKEGKDEKK